MAMTISNAQPRLAASQTSANRAQLPDTKNMVERIVDKTYLGANYTASAISGGVAGLGAAVRSGPGATLKTGASVYTNLWKAETLGPNIKILGSLVAAPIVLAGAAVGVPVSLLAGIWHGAGEVDSSQPRQFTVSEAASAGFSKTCKGWESAASGIQESFASLGAEKLKEGEKPFDIPLIKTVKTLGVAAASAAVGGVAGVVAGCVAGLREAGAGVVGAFTDEKLNLAGKVLGAGGAVLGGAVHGASYGVRTGFSVLGQGIVQTWDNDSVFTGAGKALSMAGNSIAAAAAPQSVLLQSRPQG